MCCIIIRVKYIADFALQYWSNYNRIFRPIIILVNGTELHMFPSIECVNTVNQENNTHDCPSPPFLV